MSTTKVEIPTSRVQFGLARVDVTPPVGIYHRLWGAARHDRATGVHRPLFSDVMAFGPANGDSISMLRVQLDFVNLGKAQHEELAQALAEVSGLPDKNIIITCSHTHSSGFFSPARAELPGGELILPYLKELKGKLQEACRQAVANIQPAIITYARGRCNMAGNRDYWDDANGIFTCGFNPDAPAEDTVIVARITDASDRLLATVVHYACHGTTLAWENTLISPDYVGAMRETVEQATGVPCIFLLRPCGDLGPRDGYVGDVAIADKNGRQLGYAALSTLESMGPAGSDFAYQGPVISGATLGIWRYVPFTAERWERVSRFEGGSYTVDLPLKPKPDPVALQKEMESWLERQREADARGDAVAARDYGARAERARRWLGRLADLPEGTSLPFRFSVYRMGDAVWVTCGGEPYSLLQVELERRFPHLTLVISPVGGGFPVGYLLTADRYSKGLYQEEPSILAAGCLERLIDAIAQRIENLT